MRFVLPCLILFAQAAMAVEPSISKQDLDSHKGDNLCQTIGVELPNKQNYNRGTQYVSSTEGTPSYPYVYLENIPYTFDSLSVIPKEKVKYGFLDKFGKKTDYADSLCYKTNKGKVLMFTWWEDGKKYLPTEMSASSDGSDLDCDITEKSTLELKKIEDPARRVEVEQNSRVNFLINYFMNQQITCGLYRCEDNDILHRANLASTKAARLIYASQMKTAVAQDQKEVRETEETLKALNPLKSKNQLAAGISERNEDWLRISKRDLDADQKALGRATKAVDEGDSTQGRAQREQQFIVDLKYAVKKMNDDVAGCSYYKESVDRQIKYELTDIIENTDSEAIRNVATQLKDEMASDHPAATGAIKAGTK